MTSRVTWAQVLIEMPLVAILRGIEPHEVIAIATALESAGFRCIEIPLNSPSALESVELLRSRLDAKVLIGAGTVLTTAEVAACKAAGAQFIVSPNSDVKVIDATKEQGLVSIPGFFTCTEAIAAIAAGADALKLFPAENTTPSTLRALKAVLPKSCPILPVGGIQPSSMKAWFEAGAAGFGIGSALYAPGSEQQLVQERATLFAKAWRNCQLPQA